MVELEPADEVTYLARKGGECDRRQGGGDSQEGVKARIFPNIPEYFRIFPTTDLFIQGKSEGAKERQEKRGRERQGERPSEREWDRGR